MGWGNETQRRRRGHMFRLPKADLAKLPKLYATDGQDFHEKTIWAHYFSAGTDYYLAEIDPETGEAFGYVRNNAHPDGAEWGYIPLDELEEVSGVQSNGLPVIVERDMHWTPQSFGEIVPSSIPAEVRELREEFARVGADMAERGEIDAGPDERQLMDWNIHNDHADGAGYDDEYELED